MKYSKIFITLMLLLSLVMSSCGNDFTAPNGTVHGTKGLITSGEKHECIRYEMIIGNIIWGILLSETLVFPVYFFGFSVVEGVGVVDSEKCRNKMSSNYVREREPTQLKQHEYRPEM